MFLPVFYASKVKRRTVSVLNACGTRSESIFYLFLNGSSVDLPSRKLVPFVSTRS